MVETMDVERAPVEVFHAGTKAGNDRASAAATDGAKGAFDEVVVFVFDDAAVVDVAVDGDDAIAFGEEFDEAVGSGFDPTGVVGGDAVALLEGNVTVFISTPDGVEAIESGEANQRGGIGADELLQPGELLFAEKGASGVGAVVGVFDMIPSPVFPDVGILRAAPKSGVDDGEGEVAARHFPGPPFFGIGERVDFFGAGDEVMDNLKITPHVGGVLAEAVMLANGDLLGAFDVVHAVVMIAWVDDVPVLHHLPTGSGPEDGIGDDFESIVGARRIEDEFHIPNVVFPNHDLEVVGVEVLVGFDGGLIADLPVIASAENFEALVGALLKAGGDGVATEAAEFVGRFELGEASHVGTGRRNVADQAGAGSAGVGSNAGIGSDVYPVFPNGVVESGVARAFGESCGDDGGVASEVVVDDLNGAGDGDVLPVCCGGIRNSDLGFLAVGSEDADKFNLPLAVDFFESVAERVAGGAFGVTDGEWLVFAGVE